MLSAGLPTAVGAARTMVIDPEQNPFPLVPVAGRRSIQRRLAAILGADIRGYSILMAGDEEDAHRRVNAAMDRLVREIQKSHGRVFSHAGDGLMAEFPSAVEALKCALRVQAEAGRRNARLPQDQRIDYRMGINSGEVVLQQGRAGGNAVNIAARLEGISDPGGIFISATVFEQVSSAVATDYDRIGERRLKNIRQPVSIYRISPEACVAWTGTPAQPRQAVDQARPSDDSDRQSSPSSPSSSPWMVAMQTPPRNSIAVLPFVNFGNDAAEDYFADGMVDDIITELSHFRNLFVIARNSSFSFRHREVDVREIARDLGVDYVVEGSIRRARDNVRIAARLATTRTGAQIWAEKFDGELTDIFTLQDTISRRIVTAIEPQIQAVERDRARRKPTESLDAYDYYLRAMPHMESLTAPAFTTALQLFGESMRLDPAFAPAMAAASMCHAGRHDQGWATPDIDDTAEGLRFADAALRHGADDAMVLCLAGHTIASLAADYAGAADLLDRAVQLNPNYAQAWMRSGMVRVYLDDPEAAIHHADRGLSLSPRDSRLFLPLCAKGYAYLLLQDYQAAAQCASRTLTLMTKPEMAHRILITALWHMGRTEEMHAAAAALLRQIPTFRTSAWRTRLHFTRGKRFDMMEQALRHAGLPE